EGGRGPVGARWARGPDRRHRHRRQCPAPLGAVEGDVVMPELTISAGDIAASLRKHVESFSPSLEAARVGRVLEVGDGIARVAGLPQTAVNEVLEFEGGTLGLALNLDEGSIGAVVLGGADAVEEGHTVTATGRILSVPVGDGLIGRVVDALGQA